MPKVTFLEGGMTSRPASFAWLFQRTTENRHLDSRRYLWLTKDTETAWERAKDLSVFTDRQVLVFPSRFTLPFMPIFPDPEVSALRTGVLTELATGDGPGIVVAPLRAVMELTVPKNRLEDTLQLLVEGEEVPRDALSKWLVETGFEKVPRVEKVGEFSERGEILDIFPPGSALPLRLYYFGDIIEEMRFFHPKTQASQDNLSEWILAPSMEAILTDENVEAAIEGLIKRAEDMGWSSEHVASTMATLKQGIVQENILGLMPVLYRERQSILDYLGPEDVVIMDDPLTLREEGDAFFNKAMGLYLRAKENAPPPIGQLTDYLLDPEELFQHIFEKDTFICQTDSEIQRAFVEYFSTPPIRWESTQDLITSPPTLIGLAATASRGKELIGPLVKRIQELSQNGERIIITAQGERHQKRFLQLMEDFGMPQGLVGTLSPPVTCTPSAPGIYMIQGELSSGFRVAQETLTVIPEHELLGQDKKKGEKQRRKKTLSRRIGPVFLDALSVGDLVVHRDHGLGIFKGLVAMEAGGIHGEYLLLEYRHGDKLYLPVDRINLVQRYKGVDKRTPKLDKLGGTSWALTKKKIKKAILAIANELVELYALRQVKQGHAFSPPDTLYREFEAAFPYEDTKDQEQATRDILEDMTSPRPMDRLLCGDVGYGKTEVAMRAAFKAVEDGKQVGVLVPTTLLAEQHERTFRERFARFPVRIGCINRLKPKKHIVDTLHALKNGSLDIVIGTHRLLQSDVAFKDLGLLIVDEEHRFGVRHKERLKQMRKDVDCLSLTATPIPRTLQLSLLGIRDLTVINTPPEDRLAVKTFISEFDPSVIQDAFDRELKRGGQIFYVYNRVKGIEAMADRLRRIVPGARIATAHGQMDSATLEDRMIQFIRGEIDCLVCTTIIESGIDIPSANTLMVHRADTMGLSQLYQLRGRVGRSTEQAYAYLLVPDITKVPKDARKRLTSILEMEEKGGGFHLAMEDLKIRGAGNLLGTAQSGQIAKVGYDLFLELLKEAVDEMKGVEPEESVHPEVNLKVPAYIPEEYCQDISERLRLYRAIGMIRSDDEMKERKIWMEEVFGMMPLEVQNLFEVTRIKWTLKGINCIRLDEVKTQGERRFQLVFGEHGPRDPDKVLRFVQNRGANARLYPDGRLSFKINLNSSLESDPSALYPQYFQRLKEQLQQLR